jgi:DNA polymerase III epsilon subunit-like protein
MCAVDVETTGLIAGYHDIWQIAILPLDSNIKPLKDILPFYMDIKVVNPDRIEPKAIKLPRAEFARRQQGAIESFSCADLLDEWFTRLQLPMYKRIVPLAQNWPFDRSFLIEWLGIKTFEYMFFPVYRDTMAAAAFDSDLADFRSEKVLFTQYNLAFVSTRLEVQNAKAHDALQDCITTAECYRRMLLRH